VDVSPGFHIKGEDFPFALPRFLLERFPFLAEPVNFLGRW